MLPKKLGSTASAWYTVPHLPPPRSNLSISGETEWMGGSRRPSLPHPAPPWADRIYRNRLAQPINNSPCQLTQYWVVRSADSRIWLMDPHPSSTTCRLCDLTRYITRHLNFLVFRDDNGPLPQTVSMEIGSTDIDWAFKHWMGPVSNSYISCILY